MLDLVQAQLDMYHLLLSSAQLTTINFALQRKMQLQAQTNISQVWMTPRGGCQGIGGVVEMPTATFNESSVRGPILDWTFSVQVLEVPLLNFASANAVVGQTAKGSRISAEEVVQRILDEVHHYADERLATFEAAPNPVAPANIEGIAIGYRVMFLLKKGKSTPTQRSGQVQVATAAGSFTLACAADPGADIWWTGDGTFPANDAAINPSTNKYSGSSTVLASGSTLRARAYASGKLGGATAYTIIP